MVPDGNAHRPQPAARRMRSLPWLLLSLAVHVSLALQVVRPRGRSVPVEQSKALDFTILDSPRPDVAVSTAESSPARTTPPRASAGARRPARAQPAPTALAPSTPTVATEPRGARDSAAWQVLNPRAAALAALEQGTADAGSDRSAEPSAEDRLERAILAGIKPRFEEAPGPKLLTRAEGGYAYMGHGFQAIIAPDGAVTIQDRFGSVVLPLVPYRNRDGKWRVSPFLGGSFRLYEWLDKKFGKNDPYASERRWFLERTRELREDLARKHAPNVKLVDQPDAG
jgi:hypothetical protein